MPLITTLPHEIILEITRFAAFRDSIALLITCKGLYDIYKARPFWIDQVLRLKQCFNPLLPDHIGASGIEDLKRTAWNPYLLETAIRQHKVQLSDRGRLDTALGSDYWDAKVVPGGQWLFTLSIEVGADDTNKATRNSLIRVWCITRAVPTCVASLELRSNFSPLELSLQPGESPLGLFVFVNSFGGSQEGSYLQVLRINMADESPQFSPIAELKTDHFCNGMSVQGRNVVITFAHEERDGSDALIWDWRNDERNIVRNPEPAAWYWFMAASKTIATLWNSETRSIEVHLPSPLGYTKAENHCSLSAPSHKEVTGDGVDQAFVPTLVNSWNSGTDLHQIALAHLNQETLRIDMEDLGAGRIGFTPYRKDNTYMQDPEDVSSPYGNDLEVPSDFVKTVSDHLVDLSSTGRLTLYLSPGAGSEETKHVSFCVYKNKIGGIIDGQHSPFICPFSGIVGCVSTEGNLLIWRPGQDVCSSGGENSNVCSEDMAS